MTREAVLLMAYGSPDDLDQVEAYYTDIRRGSPPPPELLEELKDRYRAIGGGSPLSRLVEAQRAALEAELARRGRLIPVYAGMRHIAPRIGDVVGRLADDGAERLVAIALAPQQSSNGAGYRRAVEGALAVRAAAGEPATASSVVASWHDAPKFIEALAAAVKEALERFPDPKVVTVVFTAHSLPARVVAEGDVYPDEVRHTADLVQQRLGLSRVEHAFQSAGRTGEPWLGPELLSTLRRLASDGVRDVLVAPVGFVADHLEVLYDIDIEARAEADALGMHLERPRSMNDDPTFIAGLADVAIAALDVAPSPTPAPAPHP
ncbi:MAG: ferrochelatase [Chloroflexi bacterium]|nr:ferrochelatase [Chloroflexota bacterium]